MRRSILAAGAFLTLAGAVAQAKVLLDIPFGSPAGILDSSDPTMNARLVRSGLPSDWSFYKASPGVCDPIDCPSNGELGPRPYDAFTFTNPYSRDLYVQVLLDDQASTGLVFSTTYLSAFNPANLEANYLGDAGFSPPIFGLPVFYQVIVPSLSQFIVVVNSVSAKATDLPLNYGLVVEGFGDAFFSEIPEPATLSLSLGGLALLIWRARQRRAA